MNKQLAIAGIALALATVAATRLGGWAVVTVENAPDHYVVGKPTTIEFVVRQHAKEPLEGLTPRLEAREEKSGKRASGGAWATQTKGVYRGSIVIPEAGRWALTIESGFGPSKGRLLAKPAIDANATAPTIADDERGRQLFASAGCVTCHYHTAVGLEPMMKNVAPELSKQRFAAEYLKAFLNDPSIKPKSPDKMQMPNPALRERDITALVAFINSERRVGN